MRIYRYSYNGFAPQYQSNHYERLLLMLSDDDFYENVLPEAPAHLRSVMEENHEALARFFLGEGDGDPSDIEYGVWVFTDDAFNRCALNHLDVVPPRWSAEIPDDAIVYDVNLKYTMRIDDPRTQYFGCFLPARELDRISNIERYEDYEHEGRSLAELKREEDATWDLNWADKENWWD